MERDAIRRGYSMARLDERNLHVKRRTKFHPSTRNLIVFAQGIEVWTTTLAPKARSVVWKFQTKGIEQLVANVACAPPGGAVVLGAGDRPLWHISDPDRFPDRHGPTADFSIDNGWAIDYAASTPSFLAAVPARVMLNSRATAWMAAARGRSTRGCLRGAGRGKEPSPSLRRRISCGFLRSGGGLITPRTGA